MLKALVTWLRRAREHAPEQRYAIRFVHEPQAHWQIRISALAAFGRGVLTIE